MNRLAQDGFIRGCSRYCEVAHTALSTLEMMESPVMDYMGASAFTMRHGILLNKNQLESLFTMFSAGEDLVDMQAFLERIKSDDPTPGTIYSSYRPDSPHKCACPKRFTLLTNLACSIHFPTHEPNENRHCMSG